MKIKSKITDIVLANRMIREMQQHNFSPDQMLNVIRLARKRFNELKKEK